jgi:hypothetical protein
VIGKVQSKVFVASYESNNRTVRIEPSVCSTATREASRVPVNEYGIRYLEDLHARKAAPNFVAIANLIQFDEPATSPYSSVTMRNCCGV